jgi:peptidoglycan/LPS O-acetylase OafA/YrhL
MPGKPKQKIAYIETMRGFACLLLVFYHVVGSTPGSGLEFPEGHFLHIFNAVVGNVRMPLFSYFSGFVFAAAVLSFAQWKGKVGAKVRRLLVPLVVVGSLHYFLQSLITTPNRPYHEIFYLGYDHFWFLQATFIIMLSHLTLSWALRGNGVLAAQILFVVCVCGSIVFTKTDFPYFSFYMALYLGPFFYGGHLLHHYLVRWNEQPTDRTRIVLSVAVSLVLVGAYAVTTAIVTGDLVLDPTIRSIFLMAMALTTCFFFFVVRFNSPFLIYIGDKSYAIYLFHVIYAAATREVLVRAFPDADPLLLIAPIFIVGLVAPMLTQWLILKSPITAYLFLGLKLKPKPKATSPVAEPGAGPVPAGAPPAA